MTEMHPYLALKLARELFGKSPTDLDPAERRRVDRVAARQLKIERRILATPEAARAALPTSSLDSAMAEIRGRYATQADYLADLERLGLDPRRLRIAVLRDLRLEIVLDEVASRAGPVGETDIEIFYLLHRDSFQRPENRTLRHILVTIDDFVSGNERLMAYRRIEAIQSHLARMPRDFSDQALRHSECPTALNGGLLGSVKRGELYPELDAVAFSLAAGELSGIVESPMGFHLVQCVAIEEAGETPLAAAREKIRAHLLASRRRAMQKTWIAGLFACQPERISA